MTQTPNKLPIILCAGGALLQQHTNEHKIKQRTNQNQKNNKRGHTYVAFHLIPTAAPPYPLDERELSCSTIMRVWRSPSRHHGICYSNARHIAVHLYARGCSSLPRSEVVLAREEQAENDTWAKQPGAREVLAQPPFVVGGDGKEVSPAAAAHVLDSLDGYLQVRFLIFILLRCVCVCVCV